MDSLKTLILLWAMAILAPEYSIALSCRSLIAKKYNQRLPVPAILKVLSLEELSGSNGVQKTIKETGFDSFIKSEGLVGIKAAGPNESAEVALFLKLLKDLDEELDVKIKSGFTKSKKTQFISSHEILVSFDILVSVKYGIQKLEDIKQIIRSMRYFERSGLNINSEGLVDPLPRRDTQLSKKVKILKEVYGIDVYLKAEAFESDELWGGIGFYLEDENRIYINPYVLPDLGDQLDQLMIRFLKHEQIHAISKLNQDRALYSIGRLLRFEAVGKHRFNDLSSYEKYFSADEAEAYLKMNLGPQFSLDQSSKRYLHRSLSFISVQKKWIRAALSRPFKRDETTGYFGIIVTNDHGNSVRILNDYVKIGDGKIKQVLRHRLKTIKRYENKINSILGGRDEND